MAHEDIDSCSAGTDSNHDSTTNVASSITSLGPAAESLNSFGMWSSNNVEVADSNLLDDFLASSGSDEVNAPTSQIGQHQHFDSSDVPYEKWFRLVDVGGVWSEAHLVDFRVREAPHYLALSYIWGEQTTDTNTTRTNLSSRYQRLPEQELPQVIKDAIKVTRTLALTYLWIDSLCVIQDSDDDKQTQIIIMDKIYRRASATMVMHQLWPPEGTWLQRAWTHQELIFSPRKLHCGLHTCDQGIPKTVACSPLMRWLRDRNETWSTWDLVLLSNAPSYLVNASISGSQYWSRGEVFHQHLSDFSSLKDSPAPMERWHEMLRTETGLPAFASPYKSPAWAWNQHLNDLRICHRKNVVSLSILARHIKMVHGSIALTSTSEIKASLRELQRLRGASLCESFTLSEALSVLTGLSRSDLSAIRSQTKPSTESWDIDHREPLGLCVLLPNGSCVSASKRSRGYVCSPSPEDAGKGDVKRTNDCGINLASGKRPCSPSGKDQKRSKKTRRKKGDAPAEGNGQDFELCVPLLNPVPEYRCPHFAAAIGRHRVPAHCATAHGPLVWRLVEHHMKTFHSWNVTQRNPVYRTDSQDDKWYRLFLKAIPAWDPDVALPGPYLQECENQSRVLKYVRDYPESVPITTSQPAIVIAAIAATVHMEAAIDPNLETGQPESLHEAVLSPSRMVVDLDQEDQSRLSYPAQVTTRVLSASQVFSHAEYTQEQDLGPAEASGPTTSSLVPLRELSPSRVLANLQNRADSSTLVTSTEALDGPDLPKVVTLCNRRDALDELDPHFHCHGQNRCDCCQQIRLKTDDGQRLFEGALESEGEVSMVLECNPGPANPK